MPDQPMAEVGPIPAGDQFDQVLLDLHGILLFRQSETLAQPGDMRVDHHSFVYTESVSQHDIGSFPSHTRQSRERF